MSVSFEVGGVRDEIGSSDFLHAFFSTISKHLEPKGWGTCYPLLMKNLYQGSLDQQHAREALANVLESHERLRAFPASAVVWDIADPKARPPWGDKISPEITDLSNYFVTSTGRDVFEVLIECLTALEKSGGRLRIV